MGELTIVPPFLGGSQTLLNADHYKVYYKVSLLQAMNLTDEAPTSTTSSSTSKKLDWANAMRIYG